MRTFLVEGTGTPSVVFLPGAGLTGLDFHNVHRRAAERTTSVRYDRAGTGWSDPVDLPRTPTQVTDELHGLLHSADVPGPYLLVGHSLGAFYARQFAHRFPDEVAGLLLLDPGHEDLPAFLPSEAVELNERLKPDLQNLPDLTEEQRAAARTQFEQLYAAWPDDLRKELIEHHLTAWRTSISESANFETEVYAELRGTSLPDVPLIVLTATGRNPFWSRFADEALVERMHLGVRQAQATLASSVPRGEQRFVDASHQYLHIEREDAVVAALDDLLAR